MATITTRKSKKGTRYRAQVRIKGQKPVSATFERKTDAKKWAQGIEAEIQEGRYFKHAAAQKHTLNDLIDRYSTEIFPQKPKSKEKQASQLTWWAKEAGYKVLADITPDLLAQCRNKLGSEEIRGSKTRSNGTVNRYLAALSHVFTIAVKEYGWLESNPMDRIGKLKEPKGRTRFLEIDELHQLLKVCKRSDQPYLYPIVLLAVSSGMRLGEIVSLTWADIDFDERKITLTETKNGETRTVPLVGEALETLRNHSKIRNIGTNLVFPVRDPEGWKSWDIRSAWNRALKEAAISDFRFHDLRHTAASHLAMNGATPSEIAAVLGHKTLQMVQRYAHLSENHTRDVVAKMNSSLQL